MKTAEEILKRAREIPKEIRDKKARIEQLEDIAMHVTSVWSDMPHPPSRDHQKIEKAIVEASALKSEIIDLALEDVEMLKEAVRILAKMPTRKYARMLSCIFLDDMTEVATADLLGVCDKTVRRWMEPALEEAEWALKRKYS